MAESARVGHVVSPWITILTWVALVGLAWLSFWAYSADIGRYEVLATLGVASVKAALVALFFMHLAYEGWAVRGLVALVIFVIGMVFALTLLDVSFR
ncbi:MAG: cytochrome C oxidase subunit IV family protein [Proteobacteria bacterium]|nr:cytochrome C oxidase subunit IV family protein [Pseudomonadota bacterium]